MILEYNPAKEIFEKVHQETFGRSGCRRIVPGQYLAVDPKGRAVLVGMRIYNHYVCVYWIHIEGCCVHVCVCVCVCVCTGAIEKQKLAYILNRDSAARLTISSPLEAHKSHTLVYHMVGVDVGFDNPMFTCVELDYEVRQRGGDWVWLLVLCLGTGS